MKEKVNFNDALTELEQKKLQGQQFENSNWGKFLKTGFTYVRDMGQGISKAWSPVIAAAKPVAEAIGAKAVFLSPAIKPIQDAAKQFTEDTYKWQTSTQEINKQQLEELKKTNPSSPLIPELEKAVAKEISEPIDSLAQGATWLDENLYQPYHENSAAYLLSKNPDIIKKAREENKDTWSVAREYANQVSFGQAGFDLFAGGINAETFDIDITNQEQRNYLFYEGDGLVGQVGKAGSGGLDLAIQLADPLWGAGKLGKFARLATLDTMTVRQADGVKKLWQQSYFVDGEEALQTYAKQQESYSVVKDQVVKLEQDKLAVQTQIGLIDNALANPDGKDVLALNAEREALAQRTIELDQTILETRKSLGQIPTLAKGHDEFYNQILDGRLTAVDLVNHGRVQRWGAMKTKMAEAYALAAKSGDKRDLIDLDLAAMGIDPQAATRLRARRESLVTIIEDQRVQLNEFRDTLKILAGETDNAPEIIQKASDDAYKLFQAYQKEDAFLNAAVKSAEERAANAVGMLDPRAASRFKLVEEYRANTARKRSNIQFDYFRVSDMARPVYVMRVANERLGRYRPNNAVIIEGVDQVDGYDELVAWVQTVGSGKVAGKFNAEKVLGRDFSQKILSDFTLASNRAAKEEVLKRAERELIRNLLVSAKLEVPKGKQGEDLIDSFIKGWLDYKDKKTAELRKTGFYTDAQGNLVNAPLLKSELQYSYYMSDPVEMAKFISQNTQDVDDFFKQLTDRIVGPNTQIGNARQVAKDGVILFEQMWRFGVLARLGYPVRNVGTEWLKFAVVGGMMKVFAPQYTNASEIPSALKKSIAAWASNKHAFYQRTSIRAAVKREAGFQVNMKFYPEYVQMNNDLRKADILNIIGDMEYNKFTELSMKLADNPELLDQQPEFIKNAHDLFTQMRDSQAKLAEIMDSWNAAQKVKRRTGTMEIYGYQFEEAYAGTQGTALRDALSSGPTVDMMSSGMKQAGNTGKWLGVNTTVYPDDASYFPNLSNYIQNRIINSPTALRVLETTIAEDPRIAENLREKVIQDLKKNPAYRDEIRSTKRYNDIKADIQEEEKQLKYALIEAGFLRKSDKSDEFTSKILTKEEIEDLDKGILPERLGFVSPEYTKAARVEEIRLRKEYKQLPNPDFDEKASNLVSLVPLSKAERTMLEDKGIVPLDAVLNAMKNTNLNTDEFSAVLSTGYVESASYGGFASSQYEYLDEAALKNMSFKVGIRRFIEVPWAKQTIDDYVAENMYRFNSEWEDAKANDLIKQLLDEQIAWADNNATFDEVLEKLTVEDLMKLGVKEIDERSIEERYFDEIEEVINRYYPETQLRSEILNLKAGESLSPARIKYLLMGRGDNLTPIVGDLLIEEARSIARPFRRIEGTAQDLTDKTGTHFLYERTRKGDPTDKFLSDLKSWYLGIRTKSKPEKVSPEWRGLTPEEQVRSIEMQNSLRALDKEASATYLFNNFRKRVFTVIGQIPEDNLVRWPFGGRVYNNHITQIARQWYKAGFEPSQADLYALHTAARARAISESRKYLYTATRKLKGVGNVPFLSPFFQAAITGTKNWGRVTWNDPSILARRVWMFDYINQHADYDKKNGNRTLTVTMPTWLIDSIEALPGDQSAMRGALKVFPQMKFDTDSFNLIFPGMRLGWENEPGDSKVTSAAGTALEAIASSIGTGPAVVIGIEELVKKNPNIDQEIYEKYGMVLPVRSILDKIAPSENITADPAYYDTLPPAAKRAYALIKGVDSAEYARINLQLFMTYVHQMETGERERTSLAEIEKAVAAETAAMIGIRAFANLTLPAIPQFNGEVNTMISLYREYQDKWKQNAFQEFIEDYPDWWIVATSMSRNPGGVLSTIDAVNMADKHSELLNQVNKLGTDEVGGAIGYKFLGMVVNREGNKDEFDPASRVWMMEDDLYFRYKTPLDAIKQTMVSKGNYDYYKLREQRDIAISQHGRKIGKPELSYRNTSDPFVREWNASVKSWVDAQAKTNPEWYANEYEPRSTKKIQASAIRAARMLIENKAWMEDQSEGNWTTQLRSYLALQDTYAKLIKSEPSDAVKSAYRDELQTQVEFLRRQNETFAYYYDRFFDVTDGEPFTEVVLPLGIEGNK